MVRQDPPRKVTFCYREVQKRDPSRVQSLGRCPRKAILARWGQVDYCRLVIRNVSVSSIASQQPDTDDSDGIAGTIPLFLS